MPLRKKRKDRRHSEIGPLAAVVVFSFLALGSVPSARGQSALRRPFAIQVNASEDAALVAGQLDSLRQRGVPAYRTQTAAEEGATFYRLRIGPFPSRAAAQRFARFQGYADPWIVPAGEDRDAFQRPVRRVVTDVVPLRPRPPRFYLGRANPVAALLMPAYGPASGARPATLRVYTPTRDEPALIENVTGVRETPGGLEFGRAERVFVKKTDEPVEDFADEIESFSRSHDISKYLVHEQLALYNEEQMARFTMLGTYALSDGQAQIHSQPGFDYVDRRGEIVRHRGGVSRVQAQRVGNAVAQRLGAERPTHGATQRVALFARPTDRGEDVRLLLLFFEK